ncbi:MAG: hypothetical protein II428_01825 [Muribaculaceae bacterium]|nr:hypothetical protein [Muribaculaceae bacterium]
MKRFILSTIMLAVVCCGSLVSCNKKPPKPVGYRFVKLTNDGKEQVEEIKAINDSDALKQYFNRMEKIIVENIGKEEEPFKAMYVISPSGDTLNTNEELIKKVLEPDVPSNQVINLKDIAPSTH